MLILDVILTLYGITLTHSGFKKELSDPALAHKIDGLYNTGPFTCSVRHDTFRLQCVKKSLLGRETWP